MIIRLSSRVELHLPFARWFRSALRRGQSAQRPKSERSFYLGEVCFYNPDGMTAEQQLALFESSPGTLFLADPDGSLREEWIEQYLRADRERGAA